MEEPGKRQSGGGLDAPMAEMYRAWMAALDDLLRQAYGNASLEVLSQNAPEQLRQLWATWMGQGETVPERPSPFPPTMGQAQSVPGRPSPLPPAAGQQDVTVLAAQAYLVCVAGGFRYWNRMAQSWFAYYSKCGERSAGATSTASAQHLRILVDEARAQIRQAGELSLQEARLLQAQMEKLAAEIRNRVDTSAPQDKPQRYAKEKL